MSESAWNLKTGKHGTNQSTGVQKESLLEIKLFIPTICLKQGSCSRLVEEVDRGPEKVLILISTLADYRKHP